MNVKHFPLRTMTAASLVQMHNLCLTYHQTPSQYLRLLSDDEPFVAWRKRVGGKVVAYWIFCIDKVVASQHEDERKHQAEKAEEQRKKLLEGLHGE